MPSLPAVITIRPPPAAALELFPIHAPEIRTSPPASMYTPPPSPPALQLSIVMLWRLTAPLHFTRKPPPFDAVCEPATHECCNCTAFSASTSSPPIPCTWRSRTSTCRAVNDAARLSTVSAKNVSCNVITPVGESNTTVSAPMNELD